MTLKDQMRSIAGNFIEKIEIVMYSTGHEMVFIYFKNGKILEAEIDKVAFENDLAREYPLWWPQ